MGHRRGRSFSEAQTALILKQMLRAVAYLHNEHICHREQGFLVDPGAGVRDRQAGQASEGSFSAVSTPIFADVQ